MSQDDDVVSGDEQRDAAELAEALERRARDRMTAPLPEGHEAAVMTKVAPLLDARRAAHRRRRVWLTTSLAASACAAALALWLATARTPAVAVAPPAPPAELLAVQARVARGDAAIAALDVEMRSYRRHYHDQLRRRRGGGAP
jgi:hypothetical protein